MGPGLRRDDGLLLRMLRLVPYRPGGGNVRQDGVDAFDFAAQVSAAGEGQGDGSGGGFGGFETDRQEFDDGVLGAASQAAGLDGEDAVDLQAAADALGT